MGTRTGFLERYYISILASVRGAGLGAVGWPAVRDSGRLSTYGARL